MGTPKCAIFDAIFAIASVLLAPLARRQGHVCNFRSQMAPSTHLMAVDDTPLVLPRRRGVLPLLNRVEVRERLHICSASCLRRCVLQSKTLNDCIAISQLHRNFAIFQKLQCNFRILHVKLHFFVSPFVPSPFGPPQVMGGKFANLTNDGAQEWKRTVRIHYKIAPSTAIVGQGKIPTDRCHWLREKHTGNLELQKPAIGGHSKFA